MIPTGRPPRRTIAHLDGRWVIVCALALAISVGLVWFASAWVSRIVSDTPAANTPTANIPAAVADEPAPTSAARRAQLRGYLSVAVDIAARGGHRAVRERLGVATHPDAEPTRGALLLREHAGGWEACYGDPDMWMCAHRASGGIRHAHAPSLTKARAGLA